MTSIYQSQTLLLVGEGGGRRGKVPPTFSSTIGINMPLSHRKYGDNQYQYTSFFFALRLPCEGDSFFWKVLFFVHPHWKTLCPPQTSVLLYLIFRVVSHLWTARLIDFTLCQPFLTPLNIKGELIFFDTYYNTTTCTCTSTRSQVPLTKLPWQRIQI